MTPSGKDETRQSTADAIRLLKLLVEPCEGTDAHSWRKCRRCTAVHGVENRFSLSMRLLQTAVDLLSVPAVPAHPNETTKDSTRTGEASTATDGAATAFTNEKD